MKYIRYPDLHRFSNDIPLRSKNQFGWLQQMLGLAAAD